DTFTFQSTAQATGSLSGSLDGGLGSNTLVGPDAPTNWTIDNLDAGQVGIVTGGFSRIGTLKGDTATDTFTLVGTGLLSVGLDCGDGPGINTVTGPALPTAWTVTAKNAGDVSANQALTFDTSNGTANQPTLLTLLGGHGLKDGEAVRYSDGGAADAHGLT